MKVATSALVHTLMLVGGATAQNTDTSSSMDFSAITSKLEGFTGLTEIPSTVQTCITTAQQDMMKKMMSSMSGMIDGGGGSLFGRRILQNGIDMSNLGDLTNLGDLSGSVGGAGDLVSNMMKGICPIVDEMFACFSPVVPAQYSEMVTSSCIMALGQIGCFDATCAGQTHSMGQQQPAETSNYQTCMTERGFPEGSDTATCTGSKAKAACWSENDSSSYGAYAQSECQTTQASYENCDFVCPEALTNEIATNGAATSSTSVVTVMIAAAAAYAAAQH